MALETLKGLKEINGISIADGDRFVKRMDQYIEVAHKTNKIVFKIQDGPIKENGKNGCQVTDMIAVAKHILEGLNEKFPCRENQNTIDHLEYALRYQEKRTFLREERGVEGTSNA